MHSLNLYDKHKQNVVKNLLCYVVLWYQCDIKYYGLYLRQPAVLKLVVL